MQWNKKTQMKQTVLYVFLILLLLFIIYISLYITSLNYSNKGEEWGPIIILSRLLYFQNRWR